MAGETKILGGNSKNAGDSTTAIHGGQSRQKVADSITEPIFCASTYTFASLNAAEQFYAEKLPREEYGRYGNPTEKAVERKLAILEGGEEALLFGSGMSALAGLFWARLGTGDEIVFVDQCYRRTRELCVDLLGKFGVRTVLVPVGDYEKLEAAITPRTKLLFAECPTNPQLSIMDLDRLVAIGRRHGVETAIDATLATPINVRPLAFGVDYVVHSCTKYLAGHNDLLAGAVIGAKQPMESLRNLRGLTGMISGPHSTYLLLRGLKTLELRVRRHNENGQHVAEFLAAHPRIERVYYPGLPGHPQHALARRMMTGFGGIVTFLVKGADATQTAAVVDRMQIATIAPSLGGAETLVDYPRTMSYHDVDAAQRQRLGIPDNMIRLACGLEDPADLIADLAQSLES